jgi:hypothetical protein
VLELFLGGILDVDHAEPSLVSMSRIANSFFGRRRIG